MGRRGQMPDPADGSKEKEKAAYMQELSIYFKSLSN